MKKCPFCKREIEKNAVECLFCKRPLVEKTSYVQYVHKVVEDPSPKSSSRTSGYYYSPHKSQHLAKGFSFSKKSGIAIIIIGAILLVRLVTKDNITNSLPPPGTEAENQVNQQPIVTVIPSHAPYNSLLNGTILFSYPTSLDGDGILTISNGTDSDAVVKLIRSTGNKVFSVYVRAKNSYSINHINDGIYRVLFSSGSDWNPQQKRFLVNAHAQFFDNTFEFITTERQYTTYSITLNPVLDGKARTSSLDPNEFEKY
jgi:hypothetical protein